MGVDSFTDGLGFFVKERKYNFKFLAVERVRPCSSVDGFDHRCMLFLSRIFGDVRD
jgi:hypothetical protein